MQVIYLTVCVCLLCVYVLNPLNLSLALILLRVRFPLKQLLPYWFVKRFTTIIIPGMAYVSRDWNLTLYVICEWSKA